MGVMEQFRNSAKYMLWLLIFSFGILWMLADTQVLDSIMAGPRSVGTVNGESITFDMYNNRLQFYLDRYQQQSGQSPTPELRAFYEEQAWNDLINSLLLQEKMDDLGIIVTDAELINMITGPNPDPYIAQQFADQTGEIDRLALQAAIEAPENSGIWIQIESQLRDKRRQEKLNSFLESGIVVGKQEIVNEWQKSNATADVRFVRFPYAEISDSTITITDADLRNYYNEHLEKYQQEKSWRFSYVSFSTTPTAKDTALIVSDLQRLREPFQNAANDSLFFIRNASSSRYNSGFVPLADIREEYLTVIELQPGQVSEPILVNGIVHLLKLQEVKGSGNKREFRFADFARNVVADPLGTVADQATAADDFIFYAEETDFLAEAKQRGITVESGFATKGNPFIPRLGQSRQVLNFLGGAKVSETSSPLELPNQFVIIKVDQIIAAGPRPLEEVQTQVRREVLQQKRKKQLLEKAQAAIANQTNLLTLADAEGLDLQKAESVRLSALTLIGAGREPEIIGHIFGAEIGKISGPYAGETGVFVLEVLSKDIPEADAITQGQINQYRNQLRQQKMLIFNRNWLEELKTDASIEDYRALVLR